MAINTNPVLSAEEYLEWEAGNEVKHEYIDGAICDMTGGTGTHSKITTNLTLTIGSRIDLSNFHLHSSDMRVKVGETRYVYPDLSIVRGQELYEDESELTLLNPAFVVEVTSPSTLDYARIDKLGFYLDVPSIAVYLIVDQHRLHVERCTRVNQTWRSHTFTELADVIPLPILNCELPLAQIYRGISF